MERLTENPVGLIFLLILVFGLMARVFYQAWWRPDDLIKGMLSPFEDPGDLNRWAAKSGLYKWFNRFIATAMLLVFLYAVIGRAIMRR
jgi:hypothetical protein